MGALAIQRGQSPAPVLSPGLPIAAVRLTRPGPHGAWSHAPPSRLLPDPDARSWPVRRKRRGGVDLFLARLAGGLLPPFFLLGRRCDLGHWPQPADLFVDVQKLLAQFSEAPPLVNLALRFHQ